MTEASDESSAPKPPENERPATNPGELSAGQKSPEQPADPSQTANPAAPADEGLPEWEPLTPELVEDEAIRGDFVIRWAVVGLALLLGISQIAETRTLIHLKNGEYLVGHGLIPGGKDVFSYTASDRRWINLSWLFDIVTYGVHAISGGIGLSIFQGLLVGLTFGLLAHSVRPNIRTWWGSICAVLAILACYLQFTVQPELVTLLGISFVLWTLVKSEEAGQSKRLWSLVPVIWVWAQLDQRAWLGWFLLLLWSIGETMTRDATSDVEKGLLWKVTLASLALSAVHPFLWESWLAPVRLYMTEYPALRTAYAVPTPIDQAFHPIWEDFFWRNPNHRTIAAVVLFAATLVTMLLNWSRLRRSHLLAFIGFNVLGAVTTHELAAASLVNCVVSTLNAQAWYRERFGQVYSVDWRELLFSRGGRAVTVLSFFALAWTILSGRIDTPGGKRTGIGFDSYLASAMSDYRSLNKDLVDDHPFNFSFRQGDLMIWGGQKTFVDSRVGLFWGTGSSNLLDVHNNTRNALRGAAEKPASVWKETFSKYQIRQAWPRLHGPMPPPDYGTFGELLSSGDFQLMNLNSSTAVFLRIDEADETTAAYRRGHSFDPVKMVFRTNSPQPDATRDWPTPATMYDNLFSLRRPALPAGGLAAQHYLKLAGRAPTFTPAQRCACVLQAIREANLGLKAEPNSASAYRILGIAYYMIGQLEANVLSQGAPSSPNVLRYFQSVSALQQAVALQPDDVESIELLLKQYELTGRGDIRIDLYQKLKQLVPYSKNMSEERRKLREGIVSAISQLEEPLDRINKMVEKNLSDGADRLQVATMTNQVGGLLKSIQILEDDPIYVAGNPKAKLDLAGWLMEAGRGKQAAETYDEFEVISREAPFNDWRNPAAILRLTMGDHIRCIKLWQDHIKATDDSLIPTVMYTLPFTTFNPMSMGPDMYPTLHSGSTMQMLQGVETQGSVMEYQIALVQMEMGTMENAVDSIRHALDLCPTTPVRPLLRFYLEALTGEQIDLKVTIPDPEEFTDLTEPEPKAEGDDKSKTDKPTPPKK